MNGKVQDDINKVEINEKVGVISSIIRPFNSVGVGINGGNLDIDIDIYFTGQTAGNINQAIRCFKIDISVDGKLTSD